MSLNVQEMSTNGVREGYDSEEDLEKIKKRRMDSWLWMILESHAFIFLFLFGSNIVVFHDVHLLYQTCLAFLTFTFNFFLLNFSFLGSFLLSSNCIQNRFPFHLLLNVTPLPFEFETLMIDSWFTCFSSILCSRSCLVHFSFIFIFLFQTARSLS